MITKVVESPAAAVAGIGDGATVMIGGFGMAGMPTALIDALIAQGAGDLTIVCNNAGNGETGLAALLKAGRVRKIICSFPRQADSYVFDALFRAGKVELEVVPQGTLVERIRAAGAGIGAFFTPTGYGTMLADGKEGREIGGRHFVLEYPIHADVALIKARHERPVGQPRVPKTARNFGPVMATAAACTVAEVDRDRRARPARPRVHRDAWNLRPAGRGRMNRWTRDHMAARIARDIPDGSYVNLGIGLPTLVANHLAPDREVFLHSENGILGMGPAPAPGEEDPDLLNAGKQPVTLLAGGAYFHHADSFAMIRGGHIDICVLGAFQVSVAGDLANWHTGDPDTIPAVGGAMDLAVGARRVFVMMEHLTKKGDPRSSAVHYPLTGVRCVHRIYTDLAVLDVAPGRLTLIDMVDGLSIAELRQCTALEAAN